MDTLWSTAISFWFVNYTLIETHNLGAVYLQGTRTPGSAYVDDEGRPIPFFRWDVGEPEPTGDYLRTDDVSRLQEVSTGLYAHNYICSIYNYFWVVNWHYISFFRNSSVSALINIWNFLTCQNFNISTIRLVRGYTLLKEKNESKGCFAWVSFVPSLNLMCELLNLVANMSWN